MILRLVAAGMLALLAVSGPAEAGKRDMKARAAFVKANPCPATGKVRGACLGYVVDHVQPLCAGGADAPSNMAWQTAAEAKIKDREEHRTCAALRRKARQTLPS